MVCVNPEVLRDDRTGILAAPRALIRELIREDAATRGARGPYELDRGLMLVARVLAHVLDRIDALQGREPDPFPPPPAARRQAPPATDHRQWNRPRATEPEGGDEAAADASEPVDGGGRGISMVDAIDSVLRSDATRWWTTKEILLVIQKRRLCSGVVTGTTVSTTLSKRYQARGWFKRAHPAGGPRVQWQFGQGAPAPAGGATA